MIHNITLPSVKLCNNQIIPGLADAPFRYPSSNKNSNSKRVQVAAAINRRRPYILKRKTIIFSSVRKQSNNKKNKKKLDGNNKTNCCRGAYRATFYTTRDRPLANKFENRWASMTFIEKCLGTTTAGETAEAVRCNNNRLFDNHRFSNC